MGVSLPLPQEQQVDRPGVVDKQRIAFERANTDCLAEIMMGTPEHEG